MTFSEIDLIGRSVRAVCPLAMSIDRRNGQSAPSSVLMTNSATFSSYTVPPIGLAM